VNQPITIRTQFITMPLAVGLKWNGGGAWIFEEKKDGVRALLSADGCQLRNSSKPLPGPLPCSLAQCVFDGELVRGLYWVFDLLIDDAGEDIRNRPLRERKQASRALESRLPKWMTPIPSGRGVEFLETVLSAGGEGTVAKYIESRYSDQDCWVRCKRRETFDVAVTEMHPHKQSIRLGERGWCSSIQFPQVKVGDVVEIACHSITAKGRFREPRILRIRIDKPAIAKLPDITR
jgi:ATP-dependent DNA ligase